MTSSIPKSNSSKTIGPSIPQSIETSNYHGKKIQLLTYLIKASITLHLDKITHFLKSKLEKAYLKAAIKSDHQRSQIPENLNTSQKTVQLEGRITDAGIVQLGIKKPPTLYRNYTDLEAQTELSQLHPGSYLLHPSSSGSVTLSFVNTDMSILHLTFEKKGDLFEVLTPLGKRDIPFEELDTYAKENPQVYMSNCPDSYKNLTSEQAQAALEKQAVGAYIIRPSERENQHLIFSFKGADEKIHHYFIYKETDPLGKEIFTIPAREPIYCSNLEDIDFHIKHLMQVETSKLTHKMPLEETPAVAIADSVVRKRDLSPELQAKIERAGAKARQLYGGIKKGAKPMQMFYRGEAIDSKGRYGRALAPYFAAWEKSTSMDSFTDWLDKFAAGQNVPGSDGLETPANIPQVIYMTETQRKDFEVEVINNQFQTKHEGILTSPSNGTHIFVISPDDKLYVGLYERGKMNHSSFLSGGSVKGAGELRFENGKLKSITDKSGHYEPTEEMIVNGLKALIAKGISLEDVPFFYINTATGASTHVDALKILNDYEMKMHACNHGNMTSAQAEVELQKHPIGATILRYNAERNLYVLSKKVDENHILHYRSEALKNSQIPQQGTTYNNLSQLLQYANVQPSQLIIPLHTAAKNRNAIEKDLRNHHNISQARAEEILTDFKVGTTLLRFSADHNDYVLSQKTGDHTYQHHPFAGRSLKEGMQKLGVRVLVPVDKPVDSSNQHSLVPIDLDCGQDISSTDTMNILKQDGQYLIRASKQAGYQAISYLKDGQIMHSLFEQKDGKILYDGKAYNSLNEFINAHNHLLKQPVTRAEALRLKSPL